MEYFRGWPSLCGDTLDLKILAVLTGRSLGNIHLYNKVPAVFTIDVAIRLAIFVADAPPPYHSRWPQTEDLLRIFELLTDGNCHVNFEGRWPHLIVSLELLYPLDQVQ